jgi:hypothetical protein
MSNRIYDQSKLIWSKMEFKEVLKLPIRPIRDDTIFDFIAENSKTSKSKKQMSTTATSTSSSAASIFKPVAPSKPKTNLLPPPRERNPQHLVHKRVAELGSDRKPPLTAPLPTQRLVDTNSKKPTDKPIVSTAIPVAKFKFDLSLLDSDDDSEATTQSSLASEEIEKAMRYAEILKTTKPTRPLPDIETFVPKREWSGFEDDFFGVNENQHNDEVERKRTNEDERDTDIIHDSAEDDEVVELEAKSTSRVICLSSGSSCSSSRRTSVDESNASSDLIEVGSVSQTSGSRRRNRKKSESDFNFEFVEEDEEMEAAINKVR